MAKGRRQLALMRRPPVRPGEPTPPLGPREHVRTCLAAFNTGPDGGPPKPNASTEILYGPGMIVELPLTTDIVAQAMVSVNDEDCAIPVLLRACKMLGWTMVDIESGRMFG